MVSMVHSSVDLRAQVWRIAMAALLKPNSLAFAKVIEELKAFYLAEQLRTKKEPSRSPNSLLKLEEHFSNVYQEMSGKDPAVSSFQDDFSANQDVFYAFLLLFLYSLTLFTICFVRPLYRCWLKRSKNQSKVQPSDHLP